MIRLWKSFANSISEMWTSEDGNGLDDVLLAKFLTFISVFLVCCVIAVVGIFIAKLLANPKVLACIVAVIAIPLIVIKCAIVTSSRKD